MYKFGKMLLAAAIVSQLAGNSVLAAVMKKLPGDNGNCCRFYRRRV
jgi:hypothetical protein